MIGGKWVAIIDKNGLLIGFNENPLKIKKEDIIVPENCDLIPGDYKWENGSFWPLSRNIKLLREKSLRELPECFYLLVKEIQDIGIPDRILKWVKDYELILQREKR